MTTILVSDDTLTDRLAAARGVRAPGPALPGRRTIGTWRGGASGASSTSAGGSPP